MTFSTLSRPIQRFDSFSRLLSGIFKQLFQTVIGGFGSGGLLDGTDSLSHRCQSPSHDNGGGNNHTGIGFVLQNQESTNTEYDHLHEHTEAGADRREKIIPSVHFFLHHLLFIIDPGKAWAA